MIDKSVQWGYDGTVYGFAANRELLEHYVSVLHVEFFGLLHQYHFVLGNEDAKRLLEVYHFEWDNS